MLGNNSATAHENSPMGQHRREKNKKPAYVSNPNSDDNYEEEDYEDDFDMAADSVDCTPLGRSGVNVGQNASLDSNRLSSQRMTAAGAVS